MAMQCIKSANSLQETIKKSKFIGEIAPCASESEANQLLKKFHTQHPHANHIVFAYRILSEKGTVCRFHDAGEPSGTAGKPIFQYLQGKQLINVLLVVIRYFGGIKLGTGGLTRAYGNTAKKVIEASEIFPFVKFVEITLTLEYRQMQALEYQLKKLGGRIVEQNFSELIDCRISLPEQNHEQLMEIFKSSHF